MSEIKTKIRTYNDIIDLFGEEKAADMLRLGERIYRRGENQERTGNAVRPQVGTLHGS